MSMCKRCNSPMVLVEEGIEKEQVTKLWQCDCGMECKTWHNIQKNETLTEWL